MKILSLFDGCSGARVALERAGIKVDKYYASEIDKYSIQIAQKNYPDTIQLGSITAWKDWEIDQPDLIVGGSPCQGFSFAGKQLNFDDPRSKLFFILADIIKYYKPKYFLLENVKMKKEYQKVISDLLGVEPIEINSALVSAQNRKRLYWTNIPGIGQPEDKGILLKDILDDGSNKIGRMVGRKINPDTGKRDDYNQDIKAVQRIEPRFDNKSGTLTAVQKDNLVVNFVDRDKSYCIDANYFKGGNLKQYFEKSRRQLVFKIGEIKCGGQGNRIYSVNGKSICLSAQSGGTAGSGNMLIENDLQFRKLTPLECERLQTLPDNYTEGVSNTQRYKMLGNGFTADVIAHILKKIT